MAEEKMLMTKGEITIETQISNCRGKNKKINKCHRLIGDGRDGECTTGTDASMTCDLTFFTYPPHVVSLVCASAVCRSNSGNAEYDDVGRG